jgi:cytidylate kinase
MDSQRALAPLRQADDAVLVDTTTLSVPGVVLSLRQHIEEHAE